MMKYIATINSLLPDWHARPIPTDFANPDTCLIVKGSANKVRKIKSVDPLPHSQWAAKRVTGKFSDRLELDPTLHEVYSSDEDTSSDDDGDGDGDGADEAGPTGLRRSPNDGDGNEEAGPTGLRPSPNDGDGNEEAGPTGLRLSPNDGDGDEEAGPTGLRPSPGEKPTPSKAEVRALLAQDLATIAERAAERAEQVAPEVRREQAE